ncbi:MAG: hypothetical protein AAF290_08255 [Pseudomonadota bacterium]
MNNVQADDMSAVWVAVLTMIGATLPATLLIPMALMGFFFGLSAVFSAPGVALLLLAWGGAGCYGTAALWAATFGSRRGWVVAGLTVGLMAIFPLSLFGISDLGSNRQAMDAMEVLTMLAAITLPLGAVVQLIRIGSAGIDHSDEDSGATE